jgi:hypothetical protein
MSFILDEMKGLNIQIGDTKLVYSNTSYILYVNDEQWFIYDPVRKIAVNQFASSYDFAYGDCVLSGLGFGVLANMLYNKPGVKSITIYEKNKNVIELNKVIGFNSLKDVTIINQPIEEARNIKCDCLLLDHYELESDMQIYENVFKIAENVQTDLFWWWRAESSFYSFIKKNNLKGNNLQENYGLWRKSLEPLNLPKVTEDKLKYYLKQYQINYKD